MITKADLVKFLIDNDIDHVWGHDGTIVFEAYPREGGMLQKTYTVDAIDKGINAYFKQMAMEVRSKK